MIGLLRGLSAKLSAQPAPDPVTLNIAGEKVTLRFRRNPKAKRMVLRLSTKGDGLVMTLPKRVGLAEALRFAENSAAWIEKTLARQPQRKALEDGSEMLLRGLPHKVKFSGGRRGLVSIEPGLITVPGDPAHAERRLRDTLKKMALVELTTATKRYATAMNVSFSKITVRDQKSRWGSCAVSGALSYSWRLILAPPEVLDYVAAHEVAHRREMNHGPKFWRLVLSHCPHSKSSTHWLKKHGREVHRVL
jgi:predicted metal-dependent hydrolase